jgi:cysteine-rich repeat protein
MTKRPVLVFALLLCALSSRTTLASDEPDALLPGKVVVIKPGRLFKFVAKPPSGGTFALPGAGNDPRMEGASLRVRDTGVPSGGDDSYLLPPQTAPLGWKGLGTPAGARGFKYKGAGSPTDPCTTVLVKPNVIKAVCKGTGVGLTLPFGGDVAIGLTVGADSKRYCATFGGDLVKSESDILKRTGAPATACSVTLSCGNGMLDGAEQCDDNNTLPGDGCDANCLPEESTSQPVSSGGTVTSDVEADGASPADPLETSVTSPASGTVTIAETSAAGAPPAGFELRGQAAVISAPNASPTTPLSIAFTIDATQVRPGEDEATVQVFRDGAQVSACVGQVGEAYPEPCVFERTLLGGGDIRVSVRSAHASTWVFGFPLCGNGTLNAGEACDPPGGMAQCAAGQLCKSDCTCSTACDCCAAIPTTLTVSHVPAAGTCGSAIREDGSLFKNLFCGVVYLGGGSYNYAPVVLPEVTSVLGVVASTCDAATETFVLGPTTAAETGSQNTCTAAGCLFGPPVAVPYPTAAYSVCLVLKRPLDASGTATCGGAASIAFPIEAGIYLTGDTATDPSGTIPGTQPCPLCQGGSCVGGPNNGMSCTAQTSVPNPSYPTSSDCPPDPGDLFSSVPVGATVTTGVATAEAKASGGQARVFCGYCRNGDGDLSFANPPVECDSDAECGGTYESCQQRTNGAFGPGGSSVKTITLNGTAPGCLADMMPQPGTMVGGFCLEPTFLGILDTTADLPGPGVTGLEGSIQLQ